MIFPQPADIIEKSLKSTPVESPLLRKSSPTHPALKHTSALVLRPYKTLDGTLVAKVQVAGGHRLGHIIPQAGSYLEFILFLVWAHYHREHFALQSNTPFLLDFYTKAQHDSAGMWAGRPVTLSLIRDYYLNQGIYETKTTSLSIEELDL